MFRNVLFGRLSQYSFFSRIQNGIIHVQNNSENRESYSYECLKEGMYLGWLASLYFEGLILDNGFFEKIATIYFGNLKERTEGYHNNDEGSRFLHKHNPNLLVFLMFYTPWVTTGLFTVGGWSYGTLHGMLKYFIEGCSLRDAPQQIIYSMFVKQNQTYQCPENKEEQRIQCPILFRESNSPVCISFDYKGGNYISVYDYEALTAWLKQSTLDPSTNVDLCDAAVTNFNISFDVPEKYLLNKMIQKNSYQV